MANQIRKEQIYTFLLQLAAKYELLQQEKNYLQNEAAARITAINGERSELIDEAQAQLDRLNTLRTADSQEALTLQQVRDIVAARPGRFTR
jgi:hypothetical protein